MKLDKIMIMKLGYSLYFLITAISATYFFESYFYILFFLSLSVLLSMSSFSLKFEFNNNDGYVFFVFLLFLLFFVSCLSAFFSDIPTLSFQRIVINFFPLFLILLIPSGKAYNEIFFLVLYIVYYFVMISILYSIILFFLGGYEYKEELGYVNGISSIFYQRQFGIAPFYRLSSFFDNPNQFSMWIVVGAFSGFTLFKYHKINNFYFMVLIVFALLLTFSRASILAFIAFFSFYFAIKQTRNFYLIICFFIVNYIIFNFIAFHFFDSSSERLSVDLNSRGYAWELLIESFYNKPLVGVGFGLLDETILHNQGVEFSAHNVHLQFLSEVGIIGYLTFITLALLPIYYGFRVCLSSSEERYFDVILLSIAWCFSLLIHQVFENTLFRSGFFTIFWFYISMSIFKLKLENELS